MAKIKVNHSFKLSDVVPKDAKGSLYSLLEKVGAKQMVIPGMIGAGEKIHHLHIDYVDTDDGIGICYIGSYCGSAKFRSYIRPILDVDLVVDCKRCLG